MIPRRWFQPVHPDVPIAILCLVEHGPFHTPGIRQIRLLTNPHAQPGGLRSFDPNARIVTPYMAQHGAQVEMRRLDVWEAQGENHEKTQGASESGNHGHKKALSRLEPFGHPQA